MIQPGQTVPSVPVKLIDADGIHDASSADILGTGTVVFFTLPGAFTPTCHLNHLPSYIENAERLTMAGVDRVVCGTVNDQHVVKAWAEASGGLGKVDFMADGVARLAIEMGLDQDLTKGGLGIRFRRAALVIRDGVVQLVNTEAKPGEVTTSGAGAIIEALRALEGSRVRVSGL